MVCFWCVWHSSKSVKNAVVFFSQFFGAFVGWLILAYLGLEGLGVFVFLVFVFLFCVAFVSVLFALFLFCCWIVLGVGSCFVFLLFLLCFFLFVVFVFFVSCFFFVFCFFFLFGGFKGQVRWPKGSHHLALNPPYVFCFECFCFFFLAFLSLFLFIEKPRFFPLKKGIFGFILSVSLCFYLAFFGPPPFSLSLSLSLSCSFLSSFLSVSHFCIWFLFFIFVVFVFVSRC